MADALGVITYNCHSLRANREFVKSLLQSCDILCLQETLIDDNNSSELDLDQNFNSCYTPATRTETVFVGRSSGGLAIYWRKSKTLMKRFQ